MRKLNWVVARLERANLTDYDRVVNFISELKMYAFELIALFSFYPHVEFTHEA